MTAAACAGGGPPLALFGHVVCPRRGGQPLLGGTTANAATPRNRPARALVGVLSFTVGVRVA